MSDKELVTVDVDAFGMGDMSGQDIVIPKVLVMQGLSKFVTEGVAKFGDFVDSLTKEVLGDSEKGLEFIPFFMEKTWLVSKKVGDRYMFDRIESCNASNENRKWEEVIGQEMFRNEKCFNFYSILPSDPSIPVIIQFKSTSSKAGKELATQMYIKNKASGLTPAGKVMKLAGNRISNDKGTYVVLSTASLRDSTQEEVGGCLDWFKTIKSGGTKTDNSDVSESSAPKPQF